MVFLHGTAIMHRSGIGRTRQERVKQSLQGESSVREFAEYVPVGGAVEKLHRWQRQGAEIVYLSSHRSPENVENDRAVLRKHGFPPGEVYFRSDGEEYSDVVERVAPDILIEDDCESIGGEAQTIYPYMRPETRSILKSIIVPEFGGIDHLPDELSTLWSYTP
jgi:hypothetical protein